MLFNNVSALSLDQLIDTWPSTPWTFAEVLPAEFSPFILMGVLLSLITVYATSKIGGELSKRLDLPPVLGELVGGVVVGISALHLLMFPENTATITDSLIAQLVQWMGHLDADAAMRVFEGQSEVISVLAELGVIVLLFEIGLESDLRELSKVGFQAAVVAVVGVVVPFTLGTVGLVSIFHVPVIPAIFAGAALTATSIGITSKVLSELGHLKSKEGQIIVGAAVIDDVLGIIVLAVVASLAKTGEVDLLNVVYLIISASGFLLGAILLGKFFNTGFVAIADKLQTRGALLIPAFTFALVMSCFASAIHLEAILGAFAAGLVLDETDKRKELDQQIMPIADILVPIFFVTVGAKADLGVLNPMVAENRAGLIIAAFLIAVAVVGKLVTGWAVFGQPGINRMAIGVGMIPRGEVGLVFAGIGSASGVLDRPLEAAIIVMVILTTFLAPPLLQLTLKGSNVEMSSSDVLPATD
ncbi:cation:proton antiporter [Leptolyngbyaceae cyanobacterium CCMR0082]|uniref:Cation:proton antiporter n=2 Tax=Adonisia turfae TaxID=2950184 RepID=A0A6M0S184_9CYAN|nr:cation:proton antiporter [Adonisia turfae]MDV3352402.1 cation:proton antiporter [Leptothoe sp. LEGE 181152]NEZ58909.1 cation:proton antiporter [Adonisia turfae CCMR0081]NEZ61873.1 cation:proton antiporter [Adonisia turfae CCMR0082]